MDFNDNYNNIVSVIIPTYNRASIISRAINSVLIQTYKNFEIIIVDDGSSDNTSEIVKKFGSKKIKYIKHQKNIGVSAARNTGIKFAIGEYIAFQDSDDEWMPTKLERQVKIMQNSKPEIGVVYSGFWKVFDEKKKEYIPSRDCKKSGYIYPQLLEGNLVGTPTALVKRECFEKCGFFNETLSTLEDWELFLRISKKYEFEYIQEPLLISYYSSNGVNECGDDHKLETYKIILKNNMDELSKNKKLLSKFYSYMWEIDFSFDFLIKSIKTYPFNIKMYLKFFLSLVGKNRYKKLKIFYSNLKLKVRS